MVHAKLLLFCTPVALSTIDDESMKFLEHAAVFEPHEWPKDSELDDYGQEAIAFFVSEVQTDAKEPCDAVPQPVCFRCLVHPSLIC